MRPNGEEREVKKERILNATFRCVSKSGIDGVRLRSIAEEAGVNPALLHYYFGDKENLLAEFIQYLYDRFIMYVESQVDRDFSSKKRVETLVRTARTFLHEQKELFIVFINVWSYCLRNEALKNKYARIYRSLVGYLKSILDEMTGEETPGTICKEDLAYHFAALVVGIGTMWYMDNENLDIERQFKILEKAFEEFFSHRGAASFVSEDAGS